MVSNTMPSHSKPQRSAAANNGFTLWVRFDIDLSAKKASVNSPKPGVKLSARKTSSPQHSFSSVISLPSVEAIKSTVFPLKASYSSVRENSFMHLRQRSFFFSFVFISVWLISDALSPHFSSREKNSSLAIRETAALLSHSAGI